jgi:hypothetical protein
MAFTNQQVDSAIEYVIWHGAENRGSHVHYTAMFRSAGLPDPQDTSPGEVSAFMERFHFRCRDRDLPPLDALVVVVAGDRAGSPGTGYFRVNRVPDPARPNATDEDVAHGYAFWTRQKEECARWGHESRRGRRRRHRNEEETPTEP